MTSWHRKQNRQHKELSSAKYRQRVVPMEKKEELEKIKDKEYHEELMDVEDELNDTRTKGKA